MTFPFGFSPSGNGDDNPLAAMFEQLGKMMRGQPEQGAVNWAAAEQATREQLAQAGDPSADSRITTALVAANDLADLWLNAATTFPSVGIGAQCLTRNEWVETTFSAWKTIVNPVAEGVDQAMSKLMPNPEDISSVQIPEEMLTQLPFEAAEQIRNMLESGEFAKMAAPMMNMAKNVGSTMFGAQFGQSMAAMATEVLSMTDIGIPLTTSHQPQYLAANVAAFATATGHDEKDLLLYIALRENALQRLFASATWLGTELLSVLDDYARGVRIDTGAIEIQLGDIDVTNPEALQDIFGQANFEEQQTPEQMIALDRLHVLLALISGWVDVVITDACADRLPNIYALTETFARRRAEGGPAEKAFKQLVGLDFQPKRVREAQELWTTIGKEHGMEHRDDLWTDATTLPISTDMNIQSVVDQAMSDDFDAKLTEWLNESDD